MASLLSPDHERHALISAHIQRLVHTQEWGVFVEGAREREAQVIDKLIASDIDSEFNRGYIQAVRDLLQMPQQLIARGRRP